MDPRLSAHLCVNDNLITTAEALDLGLSPGEIRRRLRHHEWYPVRRGVYCPREVWDALDEYVGRPRLRARAAIRTMRRRWVLSHDSAAHELGMAILSPKTPFVHVTRPGWTNAWTEYGVKHHLADYDEQQIVIVGGLEVLDPARTAVDIGREHGQTAGVVACDAALRFGTTSEQLHLAAARMHHWPGIRAARRAIGLADGGAQNPNETLGRLVVSEAGLGPIETQFPLRTARGIVWCDMRVGNHVIETDGRVKYRSTTDGGVATGRIDDVVMNEKLRERAIQDEGLVVSRLFWEDYWGSNRDRAIARLRADHADSVARFGRELRPVLADQARRLRRQFGADGTRSA